jgi:hypothetical protein
MVASEERSADDEVDECKGEWTESESESDSLIFAVVSTPTFTEGRFKGKNDWKASPAFGISTARSRNGVAV